MVINGSIRWGLSRTEDIYTLAFDNLSRDEVREFLLTMHKLQRDGQRAAVTAMSTETLSISEEVIATILRHEPMPGDIWSAASHGALGGEGTIGTRESKP